MVKYLIGLKADVNAMGTKGSTPLTSATYGNYLELIKLLVENGATLEQLENSSDPQILS